MSGRVYIAGPMTGRDLFNFPAFDEARDRWTKAGWLVNTPADITRAAWREKYGREFDPANDQCEYGSEDLCLMFALDLRAVCMADVIALLPGWTLSKGAKLECAVAKAMGKQFKDAETFAHMVLEVDLSVGEVARVA